MVFFQYLGKPEIFPSTFSFQKKEKGTPHSSIHFPKTSSTCLKIHLLCIHGLSSRVLPFADTKAIYNFRIRICIRIELYHSIRIIVFVSLPSSSSARLLLAIVPSQSLVSGRIDLRASIDFWAIVVFRERY